MRDLVAAGVYDRSVTLEVLEKKRAVTIVQELRGGKRTLVTGNPVFNQEREIVLVVTSVRDITELVELKSKLHERTLEVNRYLSELDKLKALKQQQGRFVTANKRTIDLLEMATKAARFDSNLLITGESGVGKGVLARMIHEASDRKDGQFVSINCAGIPDELFESELFGYESGAFSGASSKGKKGLLEVGDKGTVFLDEIGDMSLKLQAKVLHVIEDKEMNRLGSTKSIKLDVRIIAATNQDLATLIAARRFRQDLFFRLNTISLVIPPLRDRPEDVVLLVNHFLEKLNARYGTDKWVAPRAIQLLTAYSYPGNVRELANVVEQSFLVSKDEVIGLEDLPLALQNVSPEVLGMDENRPFQEVMDSIQYRLLRTAVDKYGSSRKAAKSLGVHQSTIVRRLNKLKKSGSDADTHLGDA
jgi:transcriptional regulator with PAS, ATPase and Fis domain